MRRSDQSLTKREAAIVRRNLGVAQNRRVAKASDRFRQEPCVLKTAAGKGHRLCLTALHESAGPTCERRRETVVEKRCAVGRTRPQTFVSLDLAKQRRRVNFRWFRVQGDQSRIARQRFQCHRRLALKTLAIRAKAQHSSARIKKPPRRGGHRCVHAFRRSLAQHIARFIGKKYVGPITQTSLIKPRKCVAPRLVACPITPQQRCGLQPGPPLKAVVIAQQDFTAPNGSVWPKAQPVQNDSSNFSTVQRPAILGQAGREMGVMVLYLQSAA